MAARQAPVELEGDGGDTELLLLPGLDGTDVFFRPLMRALPRSIRARVVEYPDDPRVGYDALLARAEGVLVQARPCFVLGWSFGGALAVRLAARHASRLRGLVLCSAFACDPQPRLRAWRSCLVGPVVGFLRAVRRTRLLHPRHAADGLRAAKAETWRRVGSRALAARARAALTVDVREELRACRAPVLYLAASHDRVIAASHGREVVRLAPRARLATIAGPHLALFTNPEPAAGAIRSFVSAVAAESPAVRGL